jgi:gamma-glutamylcyclotransferase (GGCT)/AIG2-like uncharacterized protein YtfP
MERDSSHLFVYGTLMRVFGHPMHGVLRRYAKRVDEAVMEGKLYDLGSYPGAVACEGHEVRGELYEIVDARRLFAALDRYEGSEYLRTVVEVKMRGGEKRPAWVYLCRRPPNGRRRIVSGDYAAFRGVRKT